MAIDVTGLGGSGTHTLRKTNVNTAEDFIYYKNEAGSTIPLTFAVDNTFIYTSGAGSIGGISDGDLLYVTTETPKKLTFSATSGGSPVNLTSASAGVVNYNSPVVYSNKLNIDASTATNQAVKYYTTGTPLTGLTSGNTYFLKNVSISDFAGSQSLYTFTSHTFTTAAQTGRTGPTQAQMRAAYSTGWDETYLSSGNFDGYQDWTVPVSGIYQFDVQGAAGYDSTGTAGTGQGARVRGQVSLTKGEVITLIVGQRGEKARNSNVMGGGGGGSFVVRKTGNELLFAGGGGSGEANSVAGRNGLLTKLGGPSSSGAIAGTVEGQGGLASGGRSGGGGGFSTRGQNASLPFGGFAAFGGGSYNDGFSMSTTTRNGGYGGFGGGGMGDADSFGQTGGGGGYSGGAGARVTGSNRAGGGGGSFISPTASNVATSNGTYDTLTTFNGSAITDLAAYNAGEGTIGVSLISSFTTGNEVYPTAVDSENGTNKILVGAAGTSYHSFVPINFDVQNDVIHSSSPHTLNEGEAVTFNFTGTPPVGLANGTIYYIDTESAYTYRLSTTPSTSGFTTINLTQPSSRDAASSSVNRVVVNTATDTLTIPNHGFLVDQPVLYSVGDGTAIVPLQDGVTYYVSEVINANTIKLKNALNSPSNIDFTAPGTGTAHSFIFVTVNISEDTLYIPNHGFVSGQAVRYDDGGGTTIPGLTDNSLYYVVRVDASLIRLASNKALTNIVNITGVGTGTQSLVITSLDFTTDTITVPSHGYIQGELVQYDSRGQTEISGLTTATPYYVIFVDGDNIKLATTPENAASGTAVDILASPAGVGRHTFTSLSQTPDGIYTIATVPDDSSFTVTARGNVEAIVKTFNPRTSIDLVQNAFKLPSHGFTTGTKVTYSQGAAATDIGGLVDTTDYYIVSVNRDYFKLASTADNAAAGVTLVLSDYGTGVAHTFTTDQVNGNITGGGSVTVVAGSVLVNGSGTSFSKVLKVGDTFRLFPPNVTTSITFADADVNTTTNRVTKAHTFTTADTVVFSAGGGVSPSPLVDGYYYFVRSISSTEVTLHGSASDATNNLNPIDFTTQGTGSAFTFTKTVPVGPIIRRITAIGGDNQITVDRPYSSAYTAVSYSYPTFVYVRPEGYSLHRPFDGGVEMSVGANTSLGQIIRQTRKYFRYQSGKGIQTSFGINFKPSVDIESMERFSSAQIICTTRRPHGLVSGLFVVISQATDSFDVASQIYNGTFQVTVTSLTEFRINSTIPVPEGAESRAYGFPQFFVREWSGGAVRGGMFDFQNGSFFEFDGQDIYCVRRSSTQQLAGTIAALQGSEQVFGTGTKFTAQLNQGDYVVLRGQSYLIAKIDSDTRMSLRPEYKGSSGTEKEFNPAVVVNTTTDVFSIVSHGFTDSLPVVYNSIDGEPIGGMINGRTYYVDLVDNNSFKIKASPDAATVVDLSSVGTTTIHSFTPAKSGIIATLTVDTRTPQAQWSLDPCDGSGYTGYNLDLSRIQMAYIDYSWYGAGKIRYGFKTTEGQVQYVHEYVHNNAFYESYFRSGNLPTRYEVATGLNPTYIPFLFHWGTSVIMDGQFDDDRAYLFTASSQTLDIPGTTPKSFASTGINLSTDLFTVQSHGFRTQQMIQFQSLAPNGTRGQNSQNPATQVVGSNTLAYLTNNETYSVLVNSPNLIHLTPENAVFSLGSEQVITSAQSGTTVTITTTNPHGLTTGMYVGIYGSTQVPNGPYTVTEISSTVFTYTVATSATVTSAAETTLAIAEVINFTSQGNTQYTYFLYPEGTINNTSGPSYQPLISLRLSPSVSSGLTGALGDRDVLNRMQLRLREVGISTTELIDVKLLINPRLNNLNFQGVDAPSLTQIVEHTSADTVSGGTQVYNFKASGGASSTELATTVNVDELFELSNSILGGNSIYPDGPDILTVAVSRLTGNNTLSSAKLTWTEAQA